MANIAEIRNEEYEMWKMIHHALKLAIVDGEKMSHLGLHWIWNHMYYY